MAVRRLYELRPHGMRPARKAQADRRDCEHLGFPTLADAILGRLVHNAYRLDLQGESLRKARGLTGIIDQKSSPEKETAKLVTLLAALDWNGWPPIIGIGGRVRRNTQPTASKVYPQGGVEDHFHVRGFANVVVGFLDKAGTKQWELHVEFAKLIGWEEAFRRVGLPTQGVTWRDNSNGIRFFPSVAGLPKGWGVGFNSGVGSKIANMNGKCYLNFDCPEHP